MFWYLVSHVTPPLLRMSSTSQVLEPSREKGSPPLQAHLPGRTNSGRTGARAWALSCCPLLLTPK